MHQELKRVFADSGSAVLCILGPCMVLVIIAKPDVDGMIPVVDVLSVVHTQYLTDPESRFGKQQDKKLVPAVGACLQDRYDLILLCRPDLPLFLPQITAEAFKPQDTFYSRCIRRGIGIVKQDRQGSCRACLRFHKKIEPEHILQVCVTGFISRDLFKLLFLMPAFLEPVKEFHKMFVLFLILQVIDLLEIHLHF